MFSVAEFDLAEFDLIELIRAECAKQRDDTLLGIGDDAAVVQVRGDLVLATDTLVENVHFFSDVPADDLGWKCLAVNLSDLAAMGATPCWALLNLSMPRADRDFVEAFIRGFAALARRHQVDLVGGDTTATDGPTTISVTVAGQLQQAPLTRATAREGDAIIVSGSLGDAAWAYQRLARQQPINSYFRQKLQRPEPRLALSQLMLDKASSAMDISDGLLADLHHLLGLSNSSSPIRLGADIMLHQLPVSRALMDCQLNSKQRWDLQLTGGDDYELLFTLAAEHLPLITQWSTSLALPLTVIGQVTRTAEVRCYQDNGEIYQPSSKGYEHFCEDSR